MTYITAVLGVFFTFASSIKILGWQKYIFETQQAFFRKYGLTRIHMFLVGIIELTAALSLLGSLAYEHAILNCIGALCITLASVGAIFFHLKFDTLKDAIPAMVTLLLSSALVISNQTLLSQFLSSN
ncbi:DoxX family protein [Pseudoalteromonas obscura]|uniref:DoxX family protein n=1 Tax=Pseudoalteromonas obscura TaxID=3048491 RepID=A0ABT7ENX9_9GAMM|nr:DoxX family protein [Pseudoalteromonas sp. P94(2023)]MDK2596723.1 DoxX family protein [Pseudoalteromonas sp. P94(2023)]